jgi:hypothetical protein
VVALGIDETRRGKPRFALNPDTGVSSTSPTGGTGFVELGIRACWGKPKAAPVATGGSQEACTGVCIMTALGKRRAMRAIALWPRREEPLSTTQNTRFAEA